MKSPSTSRLFPSEPSVGCLKRHRRLWLTHSALWALVLQDLADLTNLSGQVSCPPWRTAPARAAPSIALLFSKRRWARIVSISTGELSRSNIVGSDGNVAFWFSLATPFPCVCPFPVSVSCSLSEFPVSVSMLRRGFEESSSRKHCATWYASP